MALRRAHADEYAVRVNRAVELLADRSPADAVRALQAEHGAVGAAGASVRERGAGEPDGVAVPERTAVFTVRLAPSLIAGLRAHARSRGQTLSAAVAEAVRRISIRLTSGPVARRVEIEFVG